MQETHQHRPKKSHPDTTYERALVATERFLLACGEKHWADWLAKDIKLWREKQDSSHHRGAYGGMGSINDVVLDTTYDPKFSPLHKIFLSTSFEWLKSVLYHLSQDPLNNPSAESLRKSIGQHTPVLAAFASGQSAPKSMHGFLEFDGKLQGLHCADCGYSEITDENVDRAMADQIVPALLFEACEKATLEDFVDSVLTMNIPDLAESRSRIESAVHDAGIHLSSRSGWLCSCGNCQGENIKTTHWKLVSREGQELSCIPQLES
jgi:hypothetical protein